MGTAYTSLLPLLMDRCDDSRSDPRPKLLTVLVGPTGRRRGVRFLQLAAILAYSILVAGAAALRTFGLALGLFSTVGTGRPADLGEGGNSLALSPRFGPKFLRHLSCPSSFTTPLERGEGRGTGPGLVAPYPHTTPPSASLCVHHVSWEGSRKAKALWEDEPGSWSWAQFSHILGRLPLPGVPLACEK